MNERIDILLSRYFSGEASEDELRLLDDWLAESEEHEAYFDQMTSLYQKSSLLPDLPDTDTAAALLQFKKYMQENEKATVKRKFKIPAVYRNIAAIAILLIGLFSIFYFMGDRTQNIQLTAKSTTEKFILYDNAEVTLEPHSTIEYIVGKDNEVKLQGKATFSIQPDQDKKILVHAGNAYIKDIGTVFTVDAYKDSEEVFVEVTEGEVLFYTDENEGIRLQADEKASYNSLTKQFTYITKVETIKDIIFISAPLDEVIRTLENRYPVHIICDDNSIKDLQISASFDKNEPIEVVLEIIAETLDIRVSKNADAYILSR